MENSFLKGKIDAYQEIIDFLISEDKENWASDFALMQLSKVEKLKELENPEKTTVFFKMSKDDGKVETLLFSKNISDTEITNYFEEKCSGVYRWWI